MLIFKNFVRNVLVCVGQICCFLKTKMLGEYYIIIMTKQMKW